MRIVKFSDLEIHFLFFRNEFREGTYPPQGGTELSTPLWGVSLLVVEIELRRIK